MKMRDGADLELVKKLREPGQARFIEQELERVLDIADRRVAGEMPA